MKYVFIFCICLIMILILKKCIDRKKSIVTLNNEVNNVLEHIVLSRNNALLNNNKDLLNKLYDHNTVYGRWALEHENKRINYLQLWAKKQGIVFKDVKSEILLKNIKENRQKLTINFSMCTKYYYYYVDMPNEVNSMGIGTYHSMEVINDDSSYKIIKEWYTDPFEDSLNEKDKYFDSITKYISSQKIRSFANLNDKRLDTVEYVNRYCGAAYKVTNEYNKKYRNYNYTGGDCANYLSQALHEGGKFRKNRTWNYEKRSGSKAWVNAHSFKSYMLYSGRASLIAYGSYNKIYKLAYKLLPGDIIAYGAKGKVKHVSMVVGADSKGYPLVTCHNIDRYRVPWDLGWNDKDIRFWLLRVNY
ncbi:amidase domain-containing protein [Abyssisolibacter fermentans]|uniref:amidase domain-containing protein n=1 Tax=Abyssisolibacter fermentans TaxID=1766203 RepID=UPI000A563CF0|nr:amidase domain-containing protein [Abyssisolibacter fermentans]